MVAASIAATTSIIANGTHRPHRRWAATAIGVSATTST